MKRVIKFIIVIVFLLCFVVAFFRIKNIIEFRNKIFDERDTYIENFDLKLSGEIIDVQDYGGVATCCIKVKESTYKNFFKKNKSYDNTERFFIKVEDSLAVMIVSLNGTNHRLRTKLNLGAKVDVNYEKFRGRKWNRIINVNDTVDFTLATYPIEDYIKNSCLGEKDSLE